MNYVLGRRVASVTCFIFVALGGACVDGGEPVDGPPEGYTRFLTAPIEVGPGESGMWIQWVGAPMDQDMDIVDIQGTQSAGGHHALLLATGQVEEPGFTRPWENVDQLSTHTYGGVGGPGGDTVALPEGVMWRIPAGNALAVQTHYLNTSDQPILAESVLDVKLVPAAGEHLIASQFAVTSLAIELEPGQSSLETDCELPQDIELVMWANHMHELGATVTTDLTTGDEVEVIKDDPVWDYEWAFNPNFAHREVDDTMVLPAGSTVRVACTWVNEGGGTVRFPDEMCVFFGYYLGTEDFTCVNGRVN
jgi:hypothetical protein